MRKIALMLCLVLILTSFSACGNEPAAPTGTAPVQTVPPTLPEEMEAPGSLDTEDEIFSLAYFPEQGFNPYTCTSFNNRMLFSLIYQGLFAVDRDYNAVPILCKSFTVTDDLKTYTFRLESATFSDGSYLTAEDVVASLEAAKASDMYVGRFDRITEVVAVGERSVQITTNSAYENLPLLLDIPIVKASQVAESQPTGTGPYQVSQTAGGLVLKLQKNWWCSAELPVDTSVIPLQAVSTIAEIRDCFEFGDLGFSISDPGTASYAEYRCDYELWEAESGLFLYLCCNTESDVFSDNRVRAALTYAIDRSRVLEECYHGFGSPAILAASPKSPFYDQSLADSAAYDPAVFEQAVADAGMIGRKVVLLVNKNDSVRLQAARLIGQMMTDCGLEVEVLDHSTPYYLEKLKGDEYDLYLGQTKLSPTMDLSQFFIIYGALSYADLDDSATYSMCRAALENSGNFYNLHQMILKDGQLVPVLFRTYAVYAKRGLTQELEPARDNIFSYTLGKSIEEIRTIDYQDD